MAEETTNKKTGATPLVDVNNLGGGRVQGVLPVTTLLVKFMDGHGRSEVRLAALIPGGEVYFFHGSAIDQRPVQQWMKTAIVDLLNKSGSSAPVINSSEDNTPQA